VVFESLYGNTAVIDEAITTSLRTTGLEVEAGPVSNARCPTSGTQNAGTADVRKRFAGLLGN